MFDLLTSIVIGHTIVLVVSVNWYERRRPVEIWIVLLAIASAALPILIVVLINIVFSHASPVVRLNAGDESAMGWWSFWAGAWVPLICFYLIWAAVHLIAFFITTHYHMSCVSGAIASGYALLSVLAHFPSV